MTARHDIGPDVVLLHGVNNTPEVWDAVRRHLHSSAPVTAPPIAPRDDLGQIAADLWRILPEQVVLIGHSFGGYLALEMLSQQPERTRGVALVNSSDAADTPTMRSRRADLATRAQNGEYTALAAAATRVSFHPENVNTPRLLEARERAIAGYGAEAYAAHQRAAAARPDQRQVLVTAKCPLLVVAADHDEVIPTATQRDMAEAVEARLTVVASAGHMLPAEQPEALAAALDQWLSLDVFPARTSAAS